MKKYLIDGNNLIGKIPSLAKLQQKDKQAARAKTAFLIDRFFSSRKADVFLHFDGFPGEKINTAKIKVIYSENTTADERIKKQIEKENNKRNLIIVSSDGNIKQFAKVCSCDIITCEEFGKDLFKNASVNDEESRIKDIDDISTFKKLFNV